MTLDCRAPLAKTDDAKTDCICSRFCFLCNYATIKLFNLQKFVLLLPGWRFKIELISFDLAHEGFAEG